MRLRGKAARPADQGSGNTGDGGWPPVPEDGAANRDGRSLRELASAENQGLRVWPHPLWRVGMELVQPATGPRRVDRGGRYR